MADFGLYIHLPFCRKKCNYCSFNSVIYNAAAGRDYLSAVEAEIDRYAPLPVAVSSIFFGGGTPSIFSPACIERLLSLCANKFTLAKGAEISLEANPNTVTLDKLKSYRSMGINRLSLGIQSLDPAYLAMMGRLHTAEQGCAAVDAARRAGFDNLSLDIIFGLPGQTLAESRREIERLIELSPQHVSLYNLTLEEGTCLYEQVRQGLLPRPQEDTEEQMYRQAIEMLSGVGFEHYEISNFALPGRRCRHNLNYWLAGEYLGLGAGASSYLNGIRWTNVSQVKDYIEILRTGGNPVQESEAITGKTAIYEWLMLRLRMPEGFLAAEFGERFGQELIQLFGPQVEQLHRQEMVLWDGQQLRINPEKLFVCNEILLAFQ